MGERNAIFIFPPNWSACVSGPHLALPLLAGSAKKVGFDVDIWDLSEELYSFYSIVPELKNIVAARQEKDCDALDQIYFDWEDQLRLLQSPGQSGTNFGLLSGYSFPSYEQLLLSEVAKHLSEGTVFTSFFADNILPKLIDADPEVIGLTVASQNQLIPAMELLQMIRSILPNTFLVLGGNIITRLRDSSAFETLVSLADTTVLFQGDSIFANILECIDRLGVSKAKGMLPKVMSQESIPYELWPNPCFDGINFNKYVGIPAVPYVSARGCYWGKCKFCAIPAGWSKTGYGGSSSVDFMVGQITDILKDTQISRIKFIDESFLPSKVEPLAKLFTNMGIEWEAYARLEQVWEDRSFLSKAYDGGLRKLYFGIEQVPSPTRKLLGKNDSGDIMRIVDMCSQVGIKIHLFCMVGFPGTLRKDALETINFLINNKHLIDTADLVGFRLDRGTRVPGVSRDVCVNSDWLMSVPYVPTKPNVLSFNEVSKLEKECQEILWENAPRLIHPLYRVVGPWDERKLNSTAYYK